MSDYQVAVQAMENMAQSALEKLDLFHRKTYAEAFNGFYEAHIPAFDAIEHLFAQVREPDEMLLNMAAAYVEGAKRILEKISKRSQADAKQMQLNMGLAVFTYPAVLHYKGSSSRPLADAIAKEWKKAFPKSNVSIAEFDTIESGFHRKFCYITTAVCRSTGGGDNCYELSLLRRYRDGYLSSLEGGADLIRRYYDVAPSIVKHIDEREDAGRVYEGIYQDWISPCIRMIEEGRNEECCQTYEQMVETLRDQFFFREQ